MHLDAGKRTDMFIQGAQQSEETKLFHTTAYFFVPFALYFHLLAYLFPRLLSVNQPSIGELYAGSCLLLAEPKGIIALGVHFSGESYNSKSLSIRSIVLRSPAQQLLEH